MISTLASGTWTTAAIALPADAATDPDFLPQSLDCFSVAVCAGIGYYTPLPGDAGTAMIGLNNGTWSAIEPLNWPGATAVSAADVSCAYSADAWSSRTPRSAERSGSRLRPSTRAAGRATR